MNIVFVCGAGYISGKEIATLKFVERLEGMGHAITWITSAWNDGDMQSRLEQMGTAHEQLRIGFISRTMTFHAIGMTLEQIAYLPPLWWRYAQVLRRVQPTRVVHSTLHHVVLLTPFLSADRDVFHVHDCFEPTRWYRRLFSMIAPRLRCFVAASWAAHEALVALGVPTAKIRVVHNGIEVGPERHSGSGDRKAVVLGIAGQIAAAKGHGDLVAAIALVRQQTRTPFLCRIYGRGTSSYVEELRRTISAAGVDDVVEWMGFERDVSKIYRDLDIVVVPSRLNEAFGLTALEPAAVGIPVIATRGGGLREIVEDGQTGFLVEPSAPAELASRLKALIDSEELRKRMGTAARKRAAEHFDIVRQSRRFEAVLHDPMIHQPV